MNFNFLASTFRFKEDDLIDELEELLNEFISGENDEDQDGVEDNGNENMEMERIKDTEEDIDQKQIRSNDISNNFKETTLKNIPNIDIKATNISGLVCGYIPKNPEDFVKFLRKKLQDSPWEIRYLLRFLPIDQVVLTEIEEIKTASIKLLKEKISSKESIKIMVEKRHTNIRTLDIVNYIGPYLNLPVNLTRPEWILLIEIIGKFTGVAVLKSNLLFSSMIEKRVTE